MNEGCEMSGLDLSDMVMAVQTEIRAGLPPVTITREKIADEFPNHKLNSKRLVGC